MSISPELYEAVTRIVEQKNSEIKVTRENFNKLTSIVTELSNNILKLAEAQKRTEDSLGMLFKAVSWFSDTIGFGLEDIAKVMFPPWLEKHERIKIKELERRFIKVDGEEIEINLYGEGKKRTSSSNYNW